MWTRPWQRGSATVLSFGKPQPPEVAEYELPTELADWMAADDFLSLSQAMQELMSLPQSLCKSNGGCCRFSVFKGFLTHPELQALAARDLDGDDAADVQNAREFLALFEPCDEQQAITEGDQEFERRLRAAKPDKEQITFYRCRFLSPENRCRIHEDRPTGCRAYPFPHDRTIYHPGCGYEETGKRHLRYLKGIEAFFMRRLSEFNEQSAALSSGHAQPSPECGM